MLDAAAMAEEQSQELTEAVNTLLANSLSLLVQVPGVAELMGGGGQ